MENLSHSEIVEILKDQDPSRALLLFERADKIRKAHVGDQVHLRGLVEYSNICRRRCSYCGINAGNKTVRRYRMTDDEVLEAVNNVVRAGFGTVVLQGGEGASSPEEIAHLVESIKSRYDLAVTLSLGEHPRDVYCLWKKAGADRYLLRFETGQESLYKEIHPDSPPGHRMEIIRWLKELGYEAGTGIMVGIPGQTCESVASDLLKMKELDMDMVGLGPFIPDPSTPLGRRYREEPGSRIVPNSVDMALKVLALARILMPWANIPSTTAIATISEDGRRQGLNAGANVVMPNLTPARFRSLYVIYPGKNAEFSDENPELIRNRIEVFLSSLGRTFGAGYGNRRRG